jgi:hypothetical protein
MALEFKYTPMVKADMLESGFLTRKLVKVTWFTLTVANTEVV